MKIFKQIYGTLTQTMLLILGLGGFIGSVQASFDSDFVNKYTELNLGNWGYVNYTFPDSNDRINAFNRSVNIKIPIGESYKVNANFSTQMNLKYGSNFWQWTDNNGVVSAKPQSNFFNTGVGFNLGFGRLIEPAANPYGLWVFETAEGKIIRFYDNFSGEAPVANVFYSHDPQKLRLKVLSSAKIIVEFTNGHVHEFRKREGNWEIFKRSDQFGNYQLFTYDFVNNHVTTTDSHGRVQRIHFKADPSGYFPRVIDKIKLTGFGPGVSTHTFNYTTLTISTPAEDNDSATPALITIPFLSSVTHPEGEAISFAYYGNGNVGRGRLKNYTNRFGGRIKYVYANIDMPLVQNPANLNQTMDHFAADVVGVTLRRTVDDVAGGILGNWTFSRQWKDGTRAAAPSLSQPSTMINQMVRPDGITEKRYFRIPIRDVAVTSPEVFTVDKSEYGYPGRVIDSKEALVEVHTGTIDHVYKRETPIYACINCLDPNPQIEQRVRTEVGGHTKRSVYSGRNWAGQQNYKDYRDGNAIKRTVNYVQSIVKPAVSNLWIAASPTKVATTEGSTSKTIERCVNSLGQVTRSRQVRGAVQASNDFIQEYLYDTSGNVIETRYFGGDSQAVANGSLCSLALLNPQFRKYTNWSYGSISGEGYLTATGSIANETNVNTIDAMTGLPLTHHSGDGLLKSYTYDENLRRVARTYPAGMGGQMSFIFSARSGATHATKTSTVKSNNGLTTLAQIIEKFGPFGRVIETKKLGPAGWAVTSSTYDAMGRMSTATNERGGVSQYLNRDYKGRVGIRRPPEGSVHDVTYTYAGDKSTTRKVSIAKDLTSNPPVEQFRSTTNTSDIFGRTVTQIILDQDGDVSTRNTTYDLNGRWVTESDGVSSITNLNQYDAYGFVAVDTFGSAHTYNGLGKALEEYSTYGDKIDLIYDVAGRLLEKQVAGINYINYDYAVSNRSGEYNKGKLVRARRFNRNVKDFNETLVVTDSFEYKGRGGRVSKRITSIDGTVAGFGNIMSSTSSVTYNDRMQVTSFTSPSCTGTAIFNCPPGTASQSHSYAYNLGKLVSATSDGASVMSNVQYNASGDVTGYHFGNGTETEFYYSTDIDEPNRTIVRKDGALVWDSGDASADGGKIVHHFGSDQEIPGDFYQTSILQAQPTNYAIKASNESVIVDALGMTTSKLVQCEGNYFPCEDINLYNASNKVIWKRHRPFSWPLSPLNLQTPSRMTLTDVLGRRGSTIIGDSTYIQNSQRQVIAFDKSVNYWSVFDVFLGGSKTSIYGSLPFQPVNYKHVNFSSSSVGTSAVDGIFTSKASF